jgi:hypothetical protein
MATRVENMQNVLLIIDFFGGNWVISGTRCETCKEVYFDQLGVQMSATCWHITNSGQFWMLVQVIDSG